MTAPRCVLCGRPEDEATPSFSWYLSSVGDSRCPECGAPQGADLVDRVEVEGELADLRAEVAALRAEAKRADEEATTLANSDLATTEQIVRALRAEVAALREACTLALRVMEQTNKLELKTVYGMVKFVEVKFAPEDVAVLRAALEKKP